MGWEPTQRHGQVLAAATTVVAIVIVAYGADHLRLGAVAVVGLIAMLALWLLATERTRVNDRIRAAERLQAEAAFDHSPIGIALIDPFERTWLAVNDSLCLLLGRPKDDLLGRSSGEVTHPDDAGVGVGAIDRLLLGEPVVRYDKRYLRPDGTVVYGRVTVRLQYDEGDRPRWLVAHIEDVSELHALERQASNVLASLREGIIVRDQTLAVSVWNDAVLEQLGVPLDTIKGHLPSPEGWHLVDEHGTPIPREQIPDRLVMGDGRPRLGVRVGVVCPGRETRWFRTNTLPMMINDSMAGVVTSFAEETERLAAEREVVRARDRFSALVEHSTDMIVLTDAGGTVLYTSPAWHRVLGWDPTASDRETLVDHLHPDDRPSVTEMLTWVQTHPGEPRLLTFRVRHLDGSWRHVEMTTTNLVHHDAVRGVVSNLRDVTEQVAAAEYLTQLALHDVLTGLANRRLVLDRVERALEEQRREGGTVAVLYIDLDGFKEVNDVHGHAAGDELLTAVAQRLASSVRGVDTVGRLGGDEFVIVATLGEPEDAAPLVRHVEDALTDPVRLSNGRQVAIDASIGVVVSRREQPLSADRLLTDADTAMYEIKRHRRRLRAVRD
jgi:diguanylate cyclase (GGDEF)-like protein/PAS domain S-box-containing protein